MSILQKAFAFVSGPMQEPDINAFLDYIEPLSHEGVPGEKRWLTLRGVSTTTAYVRVLSEMLKVQLSPGGTHRVSLKGLALQLVSLATVRDRPSWKVNDYFVAHEITIKNDAVIENLISLIMFLNAGNSDQVMDITIAKDVNTGQLLQYAQLLDENCSPASHGSCRYKLEEYFGRYSFMDVKVLEEE